MDEPKIRLPIKVVIPQQRDFIRPSTGGGEPKMFGQVDIDTRRNLTTQIEKVNKHFATTFKKFPAAPAVARVILKEKALAKSHRPDNILNKRTCPIIGADGFGELLVSVQPRGLERLVEDIQFVKTKEGTAAISTIQEIVPYTIPDVVGSRGLKGLSENMQEDPLHPHPLKLRLFRHHNTILDDHLFYAFREEMEELNIPFPEKIHYAEGIQIYLIPEISPNILNRLAGFVGTQKLSVFPRYRVLKTASMGVSPATEKDFPPPDENIDYPLVGIIDSGTNPNNKLLSKWVATRDEYVPKDCSDYDHGSFVAGLLVHPRRLNGNDPRFPDISARIVDIAAVPENSDIYEYELMTILEDVLPKYPEVRVWNLSLAIPSKICEDSAFSDMAVFLDSLQDEYGIIFAISCGNYEQLPLRGWPPQNLGESDRICSPSDSVRGVAVGSVASLSRADSCVDVEQPSPFSRRGPGPVYLPKPELTHYGGNCDKNGNYLQTGIISLDAKGGLAENVGTSFSTPIVASLMANVGNALVETPSRNLIKALVIHSARFASKSLTTQDLKYKGFGVPQDLGKILNCEPWSATLIFEAELIPGIAFEKTPFPIPACLRGPGGAIKGEIVMTLVYDPPLDVTFGSEYCRRNVDVSLGTYSIDGEGKRKHEIQIPAEPKDIRERYEQNLVKYGFKWSPVKVYRRAMKRASGDLWRLYIKLTDRKEYTSDQPQRLALIITILDPEKQQPVYDEVMRWMNREGWITADLRIKDRVKIRI